MRRVRYRLLGSGDWLILTAFEPLASSQREKSDAQARHHAGCKCGDWGNRGAALASTRGESWRWRHQVGDQELYADHKGHLRGLGPVLPAGTYARLRALALLVCTLLGRPSNR